jgi:catechol 2,3-dioxygenase-like lactoylglutathione lyase family enzyme
MGPNRRLALIGKSSRRERQMLKHFDHLTIIVQDVDRAKKFFGLLGFVEAMPVIISGEPFASYMGVPGIEAEHVTLVLENASPRMEIQLLQYHHPEPLPDPHIREVTVHVPFLQ